MHHALFACPGGSEGEYVTFTLTAALAPTPPRTPNSVRKS